MGLISGWLKSRNLKDPVRGTLYVTSNTMPPLGALSGNFTINGIVSATGLTPTAVEHQGVARIKKWPRTGQTLPVTVDRADPTRIRVEWDEVPDSRDTARRRSEQLAESMRQSSPPESGTPATGAPASGSGTRSASGSGTGSDGGSQDGATVSFRSGGIVFQQTVPTTIDASGIPGLREEIMKIVTGYAHDPAKAQKLIQAKLVESGVLNPDGSAGPAGVEVGPGVTFPDAAPGSTSAATSPPDTPPHTPPAGGREDPAARLRKLQELHRDGLVSDEEYARLRLQILTEL